jgi:D-alanyl-D-alanine dipeptidase
VPKNRYGLQVIVNGNAYTISIEGDSSKEIVPLKYYITPLITDWKYSSKTNFTKTVLYHKPQAYVRLAAARALQNVQDELKDQGLSLKFYDAYRPYSITEKMWQIVSDERYAANPAKGSGHNRGIAVDVSLVDIISGKELNMPTEFDDFSEKAHHNYMQLDSTVIGNRKLLRSVMEKHGFIALETEWWHYYLPNAERFELLDLDFKQLKKLTRKFR